MLWWNADENKACTDYCKLHHNQRYLQNINNYTIRLLNLLYTDKGRLTKNSLKFRRRLGG